jgi:hypothetical protein
MVTYEIDAQNITEHTLLYDKIYANLINTFTLSIEDMTLNYLRKLDTTKVIEKNKKLEEVETKINNCKLYYIRNVKSDIDIFMKKYFGEGKLPNDKVTFHTFLLQDLGITLDDLIIEYAMNEYKKKEDQQFGIYNMTLEAMADKLEKDLDNDIIYVEKELELIRKRNTLEL